MTNRVSTGCGRRRTRSATPAATTVISTRAGKRQESNAHLPGKGSIKRTLARLERAKERGKERPTRCYLSGSGVPGCGFIRGKLTDRRQQLHRNGPQSTSGARRRSGQISESQVPSKQKRWTHRIMMSRVFRQAILSMPGLRRLRKGAPELHWEAGVLWHTSFSFVYSFCKVLHEITQFIQHFMGLVFIERSAEVSVRVSRCSLDGTKIK